MTSVVMIEKLALIFHDLQSTSSYSVDILEKDHTAYNQYD